MRTRTARRKLPKPLAPPPMRSRRKARKVTTLFHKLIQSRDEAIKRNHSERVKEVDVQIREMGGFEEYQRASQLNTGLHSTSRWVLKVLSDRGLFHKVNIKDDSINNSSSTVSAIIDPTQSFHGQDCDDFMNTSNNCETRQLKQKPCLRLLEIGAINSQLLHAAQKYRTIHVRAIDLHSNHPDIEEVDFLTMPIEPCGYDVIVCSMVLNYVSTPKERGKMLRLIYQQLRPKGLCFLTLPKLCLDQSQYISKDLFDELLTQNIGFVIEASKDSPKIYFWVLQRPLADEYLRIDKSSRLHTKNWTRKGQKYRNKFQIIV